MPMPVYAISDCLLACLQAGVKAGQLVVAVEACWVWLMGPSRGEPKFWEVGAVCSLDDLLYRVEHLGQPKRDDTCTTRRCAVLLPRLHQPPPAAWLSRMCMPR